MKSRVWCAPPHTHTFQYTVNQYKITKERMFISALRLCHASLSGITQHSLGNCVTCISVRIMVVLDILKAFSLPFDPSFQTLITF